tara:strand:- start:63 stop:1319 length:1257 start_codon:yes stop_codon:yes gene_type:complete
MPLDPSIVSNAFANISMPDMNALMQQRVRGAENIYKIETGRQQQAAQAEQEAAKAQEDATFKALLPAYTYGIQTGDIAGAGNLVPPELRPQLQQYIDALEGRSPQEVQAALIGSLSSSPMGQEALSAIQRGQTFGVQDRQQKLAEQRFAAEQKAAADEAAGGGKVVQWITGDDGTVTGVDAQGGIVKTLPGIGKKTPATGPDGVKLGPGERMTQEGTVELIPGSKTYNAASKTHASDKKDAGIVLDKIAAAQDKLDYILNEKNKDGFEYNFGGYYGAYVGQNMPVGSAQDMYAKLESLKADLKGAGLEQIRAGGSIGQITEAEWPIIEKQMDSITPYMSEQAARDALTAIKQRLANIAERATEAYDMQWGDTQFYSPVKAKPTGGGGGGGGGISEGTTATNPQTGERVIYRDGQWQPL